MSTLYLVGCSAAKRATACPARDLYTGDLFVRARALVELRGSEWAILSALHGVVMPDQVVEPYDARLPERTESPLLYEWADGVVGQMLRRWRPGMHVVLLAGKAYGRVLELYADDLGFTWEAPLRGLGIGQQKQWLARAAAAVAA